MQETVSLVAPHASRRTQLWRALVREVGAVSLSEWALAVLSAVLLVLAFPDFNLWPLAWVGLVPLAVAVVRRPRGFRSFLLGWVSGTLFFYGSTYWLTHAMIHFGGLPRVLAYALLLPATIATGFFPGVWCLLLARTSARWGWGRALAVAPFVWAATEWARLGVTGQLWNAIGYSQAYTPTLIQAARWGGVYAVGFLIAAVNAALVFLILKRNLRSLATAVLVVVAAVASATMLDAPPPTETAPADASNVASNVAAVVVGVQPNVSANFGRTAFETATLVQRHLSMSADALDAWDATHAKEPSGVASTNATNETVAASNVAATSDAPARVVVWPESPMNFAYTNDAAFREVVGDFARKHGTAVIFNSLEPAPAGGAYNSAVLINKEGRLVAQYDKIRLLPFGEYVPLPRWLPATWLLAGIVGDFTPGEKYLLMPLGGGNDRSDGSDRSDRSDRSVRAGVFICFESAFPSIARRFADEGADVLVNISNDGYLGRTPVMRQHLANTVFRAVETNRPVLRVTNTGISALITPRGRVLDATAGFEPAVRTWTVGRAVEGKTFYTRHGDIFAYACVVVGLLAATATVASRKSLADTNHAEERDKND